ncbi:3-dehydroquinate dehydratase [Sulfuricurvum sp.]|uniref:3-dehydroquinate dehydratase n=1 Tax=Sulfuricurvum sp. TaxID=2025608 RepID=UPI0026021D61|nr:3-dehydroquinate dehydratase [Sulfuricurvum sp.]MDD2839125.1 3-dehydroquinate dehydratase [Sulfuricurvum sp.]MDD3595067.1 3-dehydroquinate dehydratase [Sulfuricurvum sp.]MDD4883336.1 3-dehydroquinate dehydratase [Sulfuricurvum sp.]
MLLSRGLAALTFLFFSLSLNAEYLYKDDVVHNPKFAEEINAIGAELKAKTGVSLYLVMVRDTNDRQDVAAFEKQLASELKEPAVIMTFIELQQQVDILARPVSLYEHFNKAQILSPNATFIGSVVSAIMFARSYDEAKELIVNRGGTVLPILAEKTKGDETVQKYSVAMFNGYSDTADQIAESYGVTLSSSAGNGSRNFIDILRIIFYGIILFAIAKYLRGKYFRKKETNNE